MTYSPDTLNAARDYLIAHGAPGDGVGIVGDVTHGTEGYHVGWDRLRFGYGEGDYSWGESPRDNVYSNAAMGLDLPSEGFARWRELTLWLVEECKRGAPDAADIREIIYTPDGSTVKRWDRLGKRPSGDSSHLWHTHISYFRDSEGRDKTSLFRRFFEGQVIAELSNQVENFLMGLSQGFPKFTDNDGKAQVNCPVEWEIARGKREGALAAAVGRIEAAVTKPATVTVNVDAGAVATALAANAAFINAIAKAVNDDTARRLAA